jgi:hypothetical protein
MDEETLAFGSIRLIPAQRLPLEEGKPLHRSGYGFVPRRR